jgi:ABC-type phosphate transport system substrate-binding protein
MRNHQRVRRMALTALCAGTSLGAAGLAVAPGSALAAKAPTTVACSNITGSGSTLQTPAQQNTFSQVAATDGAFKNCTSTPSVFYNYESDNTTVYPGGGTGSGAAQKEFASASPNAITPGSSSNATWLDGFGGMDAAPNASNLSLAATAAGTDAEVVPIMQAPVAIVVNLPTGCKITANPKVTNVDLLAAWENNITWQTLLTDAKAKPSGTCNSAITLEARSDSSGTTYAFRQYLYQLSQLTGDGVYTTNQISTAATEGQSTGAGWPSSTDGSTETVSPHENDNGGPGAGANSGSFGVSHAVATNPGSMGYVNAADANQNDSFNKWSSGKTKFWVELQNNGIGTAKVTAVEPATGTNKGNCYATYTGSLPSNTTDPDWSNVAVANPTMKSKTVYSLCTLTYDEAWHSYAADSTVAAFYNAKYSGETAAGVGNTVKDYLTWLVSTGTKKDGQAVVPTYYAKLPANIEKFAAGTVKNQVAVN